MAFAYPSFLFALAAIAIPVILHLIQLRRAKRVVFSNLKFIQVSKDITSSQRTLKELLILLSRILFITFLVLAFAQPFLPATDHITASGGSDDVALVIDNSFSTQNLQAEHDYSVLTGAVERGKSIVNIFPASTPFTVLSGKGYTRAKGLGANDAKVYLDDIDYTVASFPNYTSSFFKPSHFFLLSDFQKGTFKSSVIQRLDSTTQVHIIPIAGSVNANIAVDSVYLEDEFIRGNSENVLHVKLKNTGMAVREDVPIKLFIDETQVAALSLDLPAQQTTEAIINFRLQGNRAQQAYVQVDDFPVDFDNTYYFTFTPSTSIKVTEIYSGKASTLSRLFGAEPIFQFNSFPASNPDYAALSASDFVVLNTIDELSSAVVSSISNYVRAGGTILVSPGAKVNSGSYNSLFQGLNISASVLSSDQGVKTALTVPERNHPFFRGIFSGYDASMTMPVSSRRLAWSKSSEDILRFRGGTPFLSRFDRGNGKVFLMAAPLDEQFNTLVNHALFVPVMYKLAMSGYKQEQALAYTLGSTTIRIPLKEAPAKDGVFKLEQDSTSFIPEQQIRGGSLYFNIPDELDKAGFYTLKYQDKTIAMLAFNYNKAESELDQYTPDELKALVGDRPNVHVYDYGDVFSVKGEFEKRYFGVKLWKYCLILCLVFLMAEIALIRFL